MNKFIDYFELKEEYRNIKPYKLPFQPGLNVIVGENGSGKSTLFQLISPEDSIFKGYKVKLANPGQKVEYRGFDTEKMNPRLRKDTKDPVLAVLSSWASHGETMLPILEWCKEAKNASNMIIFIDEPEAGISLRNQKKLFKAFKIAEKNGNQVIITTHSFVLIKSVEKVFDLDKKEWVSSTNYLERTLGKIWLTKPVKKKATNSK